MDFVWIFSVDFVWILVCGDFGVWILCRFWCVDFMWILCGFCADFGMDFVWIFKAGEPGSVSSIRSMTTI